MNWGGGGGDPNPIFFFFFFFFLRFQRGGGVGGARAGCAPKSATDIDDNDQNEWWRKDFE